jgi:hypothetical protein
MAFTIPKTPLPLDFQSFLAAINNVFHFLDVVPQSWTRFLFEPSDEDVDKVCTHNPVVIWPFTELAPQLFILPLDFQIPK